MSPSGLHVNKPLVFILLGLGVVVIVWYKISGSHSEQVDTKMADHVTSSSGNTALEEIPSSLLQDLNKVDVKYEKNLQVEVGGKKLTITYRDANPSGAKLDVLFLHGQSFTSETWVSEPVFTVQLLYKLGYRAVAVDLPGFGTSSKAVVDPAQFLEAFIAAVKLQTPVIVSPSMSGGFSIPFLCKDPEQVLSRSQGFVPVAPVNTENYRDAFKSLKIPTLIIYGRNDKSIGPSSVANLKNLPNKTVVELKDAGHACYMNKPAEFNQHLYTFLKSLKK